MRQVGFGTRMAWVALTLGLLGIASCTPEKPAGTSTTLGTLTLAPGPQPPPDPAVAVELQALIDSTPDGSKVFRLAGPEWIAHVQSGMTCGDREQVGQMKLIRLFVTPGTVVGDDVGCDYEIPRGKTTVFSIRQGNETVESYLASTLRAMMATYPGATPNDGLLIAFHPTLSKPVARGLRITVEGEPYITAVWIAAERGWIVKVRSTFPEADQGPANLLAGVTMIMAQKTILDHTPQ